MTSKIKNKINENLIASFTYENDINRVFRTRFTLNEYKIGDNEIHFHLVRSTPFSNGISIIDWENTWKLNLKYISDQDINTDNFKCFSARFIELNGKKIKGFLKAKGSFYWDSCQKKTLYTYSLLYDDESLEGYKEYLKNFVYVKRIYMTKQMDRTITERNGLNIHFESIIIEQPFEKMKNFFNNFYPFLDEYFKQNDGLLVSYMSKHFDINTKKDHFDYKIINYKYMKNNLFIKIEVITGEKNKKNKFYINLRVTRLSDNSCYVSIENELNELIKGNINKIMSKESKKFLLNIEKFVDFKEEKNHDN